MFVDEIQGTIEANGGFGEHFESVSLEWTQFVSASFNLQSSMARARKKANGSERRLVRRVRPFGDVLQAHLLISMAS